MENVVEQMLSFFGMTDIPTDFSAFMYYFLGMCCAVRFVEFVVYTCFGFVRNMNEVRR